MQYENEQTTLFSEPTFAVACPIVCLFYLRPKLDCWNSIRFHETMTVVRANIIMRVLSIYNTTYIKFVVKKGEKEKKKTQIKIQIILYFTRNSVLS